MDGVRGQRERTLTDHLVYAQHVLSTLPALAHLILTMALQRKYYYVGFIVVESECGYVTCPRSHS